MQQSDEELIKQVVEDLGNNELQKKVEFALYNAFLGIEGRTNTPQTRAMLMRLAAVELGYLGVQVTSISCKDLNTVNVTLSLNKTAEATRVDTEVKT